MIIDTSTWNASDYAAWWGAIIATFAFIWNLINTIRDGARIKITATPNMVYYPPDPVTKGKSYISLTAVNRGNSATTITNFCGYYAKSRWDVMRKKAQYFVVNTTELSHPIPKLLNPGEEWKGMLDQGDLEKKKEGASFIYVGVVHNQSKKPIYKRVKLNA